MASVVMSVPHSGTRTLVEHLGITPKEQGMIGGRWWHFGYHDYLLDRYKTVHLHIPVRYPLDVAYTWARQGKNLQRLLDAYASMFRHLDRSHTLHKIEDLPRLAGYSDNQHLTGNPTRIAEYKDTITQQVLEPHHRFFAGIYPEKQG